MNKIKKILYSFLLCGQINNAGSLSKKTSYLLRQYLMSKVGELSRFSSFAIYVLLKLGADINGCYDERYKDAFDPYFIFKNNLNDAISAKDIEKIRFLIKNGADICHVKGVGWGGFHNSPLCYAIRCGEIAIVESLNVSGQRLRKLLRPQQIELLQCALVNRSYEIAKILVEKGISFEAHEKEQFFHGLLSDFDSDDFDLHYTLAPEADPFFKLHDTFEQQSKSEHILVHTQKDKALSYTVKNHFGKLVSGKTRLQLVDPDLDYGFNEIIEKEMIRSIVLKMYQDDYDTLIKPYVKKAISELDLPADEGGHTVQMPADVRVLIAGYVNSDLKMPRP